MQAFMPAPMPEPRDPSAAGAPAGIAVPALSLPERLAGFVIRTQPLWMAGGAAASFVALVALGEAGAQAHADFAACFADPSLSTCGHGFGCACHTLR